MSATEATEIRCTEESKGGLKYDVILAEAIGNAPSKPQPSVKSLSEEEILQKLEAATVRRTSFENGKIQSLNEYFNKVEESLKKKEEEHQSLMMQKKEALDQKIANHHEKREAYLNCIKSKLKDHTEGIEKTRSTLVAQEKELVAALEEKMKGAEANRQEIIQKVKEKIKQREDSGKERRAKSELRKQDLINQIEEKLKTAALRRSKKTDDTLKKLKDHDQRVEMVRQKRYVNKEEKDVKDEKVIVA